MLVENTHALKLFLMMNLSKLCNADPAALTKYVLALLKKNRPENELKAFLLDQLDVFLQKQTPCFVDLLLKALKTKAYIENVPEERVVVVPFKNDSLLPVERNTCKPVDNSNFKAEGDNTHIEKRDTKAIPDVCVSSREYERKRTPPPSSPKMRANAQQDSPQQGSVSETSSECDSNAKDRNIPVAEKSVRSNYIKRCDNYDKLGYCLKGSLCAFDHGCDPILVEDVSALSLNHNFTVREDAPFVCEVNTPGDRPKSPLPPLPTTSPPPLPPLPPVYPPPPEPYNPECPAITSYYPPFCMPTLQSGPQRIKPQRVLIGVPTHNTHKKEHREDKKKRKPFDFSRLGPPPKKLANEILEIRKIPRNLNTISLLNSHFSEFGRIVNIEVAYEGDPEAALIKFASPLEAATAFRSSVAIFNNRFIKVFYHGGAHKNSPHTQSQKQSETMHESGSNFGGLDKKSIERDLTGNLVSRRGETVYIPSQTPTERIFQKSFLFSPENHPREVKKESNKVEKQLDLLRKKYELLKCSINHEKIILAKLIKCKKKKEKDFLKKTIDQIASKISTLKSEIEREADGLKKQLIMGKISKSFVSKSEKELLDAEMDIYKERKSKATLKSKETANLLSQVNELKEKAKSLGFTEESLPLHAGAKHAHAKMVKKSSVHGVSRPKEVLVCSTKNEEELLKHFEQFGPIERIEDKNSYKLVTFSSRSAAEAAFSQKIDDVHVVWYQDPQVCVSNENMDKSTDSCESKPINSEILGDDEEEEDEEDSEARSWRR